MSNDLDSNAPFPTIESYGAASLDATAPTASCEAYSGARSNETSPYCRVPFPRIEATALQRTGNMDATAPFPELDAESGQRGSMDATAPTCSATGYGGASLDSDAPTPEIVATCSGITLGNLDKKFPTASLEARGGLQASNMTAPFPAIEATGSSAVLMKLDKKIASPTIEASGYGPFASLDMDMPFPGIVATGGIKVIGTMDAKAPGFKITASGAAIGTSSLDAKMAPPKIEATSYTNIIQMDTKMAAPIMGIASGTVYGSGSSVFSGDRFDNILLRYERWA